MMRFASFLIVSTSTLRVGSNSFKHSIEIPHRQKHLDKNNQEHKNKKATRLFILLLSDIRINLAFTFKSSLFIAKFKPNLSNILSHNFKSNTTVFIL